MPNRNDYPVLEPFNPLDKRNLGESMADILKSSVPHPLPPEPFIGAGVYALYYTGDFPAYEILVEANRSRDDQDLYPIYVGKAVPKGARKGSQGDDVDPGMALYNRLKDHAKSIEAAKNLKLDDFRCRFLSLDDIWIPLTESLVIEQFKPVWNCSLEGFGNHDPGSGRRNGMKSPWDCLHPGREWAARLRPRDITAEELEEQVREYLAGTLH